MKVTLDLAKLVEQGRLTQAEAERLKGLAAEGTGSLALNILIGFGVVAVALGVMGLVPQPVVAVVLGGMMAGVGLGFVLKGEENWAILANICLLAGSLMLAAGVMFMTKGSVLALMTVTAIFVAAGIVARSGLLIALAVLALSATIGARTGYMRATYFLGIEQPLVTVLLFSALALAAYHASKVLKADHARLAITAARTSLLLVNFGFWIGSLWGDRLSWFVERAAGAGRYAAIIPAWTFSILWAVAIVGAGMWAARANRPWVLNLAAVFGAIHFYTQWFEKLGPNPFSVLVAGVLTLGLAVAIWKYNQGKTIPA
jgi:iron complex transport system permease protein